MQEEYAISVWPEIFRVRLTISEDEVTHYKLVKRMSFTGMCITELSALQEGNHHSEHHVRQFYCEESTSQDAIR